MKTIKLFRVIVILLGIFMSACGAQTGPAASSTGGGKPQASEVAFTGVIESIDGDQWVVNGQTITVAASVINNGPFQEGDIVKVEARVDTDGSVVVLRVETPSAADLANDNSHNSNSNDATNANDDNNVNGNANADDSNDANSNDANGANSTSVKEILGTVDAITDTSITVDGQTYQFAPGAEIKGAIIAGDFVKIHLIVNADGSLTVREVGLSDPSQVGDDNNSNDDNGNDDNSNDDDDDDNGNSNNSNDDDDGNDDNSNGGNSNGG